jgi:phage-related protein
MPNNEVEKLEVVIDTSAKSANRSLGAMETHLEKIAENLTLVTGLTKGLYNIGSVDVSGLKELKSDLDAIFKKQKNVNSEKTKPRVDRSDLKYTEKSFDALLKKFKDVGKGMNLSGLGETDLEKGLAKAESQLASLQSRLQKKLATENVTNYGKAYASLAYDIQKATNEIEQYKTAIDSVKAKIPEFTIERNDGSQNNTPKYQRATSPRFKNYEISKPVTSGVNMKDVWAENNKISAEIQSYMDKASSKTSEATSKMYDYSSAIKRTKEEIAALAKDGYIEGDDNFDAKVMQLEQLKQSQKEYRAEILNTIATEKKMGRGMQNWSSNKEIKSANNSAKGFRATLSKISKSAKDLNKIKSQFDSIAKSIRNVRSTASKALHPIKSIKELLSGDSGKSGMSLGRMVGSSILFSSVFGAISTIKNAIKEGSDNLVQYSSEYNKNISSIATSLLYLKNAWAAAFAPILNVVEPYLSAFIDMMASAINKVGQFFGALTGKAFVVQAKKAWKDYGQTLKDTGSSAKKAGDDAKKAAKDFQTYTLGIDELNVQPQQASSSSSGSGGSGSGSGGSGSIPAISDMFETVEVSNSMANLADKFKKAIAKSDFTEIGAMIGNKIQSALEGINWKKVYSVASNFGRDIATFLNGLISPELFYDLGATIANAINTALHALYSFAANFDWANFGESLASSITGFFENWDAGLTGETLSKFATGLLEAAKSAVNKLKDDETFKKIGQKIVDFLMGIDWVSLEWSTLKFFKALLDALFDFPVQLAEGAMEEIIKKIFGADVDVEIPAAITDFVRDFSLSNIPGFKQIHFLGDLMEIPENASAIVDKIKPLFDKETWKGAIQEAKEAIVETFTDAWEKVKEIFAPVIEFFSGVFGEAYAAIKDAWAYVTGFFSDTYSEIKKIFKDPAGYFREKFTSAYKAVKTSFAPIAEYFSGKWEAVKKIFSVKNVQGFFRDGFQKAYNTVTDIWNGLTGFFKKLAKDAFSPIKKLVNGIIKGINWVLDKVGSKKRLNSWSPDFDKFAKGSNGLSHNTMGIVNDQKGSTYKELIVPPNGKPFIPEGRNVMLPLQKGTKIMPANQTKKLVEATGGVPKFAGGIGDFFGDAWSAIKSFSGNVLDYLTHPGDIVKIAIDKFTDMSDMVEPWLSVAKGAVDQVLGGITDFIKGIFDKVGGRGVEGAVRWAINIANDNSHGYDQRNRWGNPDYDCSALVISAFQQAGIPLKSAGANYTGNIYDAARSVGFADVTGGVNRANADGMRRGDILLSRGHHTAIYIGNGQVVQASSNEHGGITGGRPGDQNGREIWVTRYYNFPWTDVLRYAKFKNGIGKILPSDLVPAFANGGFPEDGLFMANHSELVGQFSNGKTAVANNDQIVTGIENGVYRGMMRAQSEDTEVTSLLGEILTAIKDGKKIVVDGRELVSIYDNRKSRNGFSFT